MALSNEEGAYRSQLQTYKRTLNHKSDTDRIVVTILKKSKQVEVHPSGNIFCAVAFQGKEFFYPVAVVSLKFDGIPFHGPAAGEFSFHEL